MKLNEIRKTYPQYDDLSDKELADSLHSSFYSDMDRKKFDQTIGFSEGPSFEPWEPTLLDKAKSFISPNRAAASNELAAREIAQEQGISTEEAYRKAGGNRPIFNPEGRPPIGATLEAGEVVAKQLPEVPTAAVNTVLRAIRGGDETAEDTRLDKPIQQTTPEQSGEFQDPNYDGLQGIGQSLGFSLTNLAASALAAVAASPGGPVASGGAGMAASGTVAYRASKDQFLDRVKTELDAKSEHVYGRPLSAAEWASALDEFEGQATKYGAFEAIPEAVGNLIFLKALSAPLKGVGIAKLGDIAKRAMVTQASEQTTETVTGVGQNRAELEAGLTDERLSPADVLREQALNVGVVTGLMGGAGGAVSVGQKGVQLAEQRVFPERTLGRQLLQDVEQTEFTESTDQLALSLLDPNEYVAARVLNIMQEQGALAAPEEEAPEMAAMTDIEKEEYQHAVETGLPMDTESIMGRAKDMGFDTENVYYHGTDQNFDAFDPEAQGAYSSDDTSGVITLTPDPDIASDYAKHTNGEQIFHKTAIEGVDLKEFRALEQQTNEAYELYNRLSVQEQKAAPGQEKQALRKAASDAYSQFKKLNRKKSMQEVTYRAATGGNVIPVYVRGKIKKVDAEGKQHDARWMIQEQNKAKNEGYQGIQFVGMVDGTHYDPLSSSADTLQVFNSKDIRSVNAAFDPEFESSPDLLASKAANYGIKSTPKSYEKTRAEYEKQEKLKSTESFYVDVGTQKKIHVMRNPSPADVRAMTQESIESHGRPGSGDPALRFTYDADGNVYRWSAIEAIHSHMEPVLSALEGVELNQNANNKPSHRGVVRKALYEGKMVPEKVLAEYPGIVEEVKAIEGNQLKERASSEVEAIRDSANQPEVYDAPATGHVNLYGERVPERSEGDQFSIRGEVIKLEPENKPTRREEIRSMLEGIIGPRIYDNKVKGKSTLGFYRRNNSEVRIKKKNNVEVMAHEMAHYLDFHHSNGKVFTKFRNDKKYTDQIQQFSYTTDKRLIKSEGFAEFVRLWLTRFNEVDAKAPKAVERFELLLKEEGLYKQMKALQKEMHKWYKQGPRATFRAKSGKDLSPKQQVESWLRTEPSARYRQNIIDKLHGFKVVERVTSGKIADAANSAYKQFQMVNGAEGMHEAVILYGTPELTAQGDYGFRGKGLADIFEPASKHGWERFDQLMEYFKARRAEELYLQDRENLFTAQEIETGLKLEDQYPEFKTIFADFQQFNKEMLDFYVDMGLITDSQRKSFLKANQNYVPFHRIIEKIEDGGDPQATPEIGQRLFGGDMNTREIAENITQSLFANIRGALLARAKVTLYKDLMISQEGSNFAVNLPTDSRKVKIEQQQQAENVAGVMANLGLGIAKGNMIVSGDVDGAIYDVDQISEILGENPEMMSFWQFGIKPKTSETYVDGVVIDGKQHWFEVRSPLLVNSLTGMRGLKVNPLLNALFTVKNIQTRTVTSMLQFLGPNAIRDTVSGALISENKFRPFLETLKGMKEMVRETDQYKEFMLNGGGYGTRIEARTEEKRSQRRLGVAPSTGWDKAVRILSRYDRFSSLFEYGSRIGDYKLSDKAGKNRLEAAWQAREITTDFSKMGRADLWASYLRMVPFMNAGIQGLDKTARIMAENDGEMTLANLANMNDHKVKFYAAGGVVTAMTVLLWLLNSDDERYKGLTPDQKARFWWIFLDEESKPIKIPRPYDVGHIFATIPEITLDYISDKDGKSAAKALAWAFFNTLGVGDYPGVLQPIVEVARDKKFTGAPVVPRSLTDVPAEFQYTDRTPIVYRELGKHLKVSPIIAEHYAKGYFRYVEQLIVGASESFLWDAENWGPMPFERGPADYAFQQFTGPRVPYRTKWTEGYFDLKKKAAGMSAAKRNLQRELIRDGNSLKDFYDESFAVAMVELNKTFAKIDKEFKDQNVIMAAIKYNKNLTRSEKESQIEGYYAAKNKVLGEFYKQADTLLKDLESKGKEKD